MKIFVLSFFAFLGSCQTSFPQKVDSACLKIVNLQLEIIKNYLGDPNADTSLKRVDAINFLTELTGIPSESDGNYIGQTMPTKRDYLMWSKWLILNETSITIDKKLNKIMVQKFVKLPGY